MSKIFNSVSNAVSLEKTMNKGCTTLVADFVSDILAANAEDVKNALKKALKSAGFVPSNCFSMKCFNTAAAIAAAGIAADDVAAVMTYCKIKASFGEKMTASAIAAAIEKNGGLYAAMLKAAKDAAQPAAKKAAKTAAAKKGAATRAAKKGGSIIPAAVRQANQSADSKDAQPTQSITPAAKIDRAVNAFLALTEDERTAFINAVKSEINTAINAVNAAAKTRATKKEKAA